MLILLTKKLIRIIAAKFLLKIGWFSINRTQADLLELLLMNNEYGYLTTLYGFTSSMFQEFKMKGSFDNHKEFLLEKNLIRIEYVAHYPNVLPWVYYDITPLGVLAYLKATQTEKAKRKPKISPRFIPLIEKHWDDLSKKYGKLLDFIFEKSINQINIESNFSKTIIVNTTINLNVKSFILNDFYNPIKFKALWEYYAFQVTKKSNSINNDLIIKRLTFIFYFNLLTCHKSKTCMKEFWLKNKIIDITNLKELQFRKDTKDLIKHTTESARFTFRLLKKDKHLHKLFKKTIHEITVNLRNDELIQYIKKNY